MMAETAIEWTDFTVNFWWGCTKVGPGCDHCYAETWDKRVGGAHWGVRAERRKIAGASAMLRKINRNAPKFRAEHDRWPNVFLHSMSDMFDNVVPETWRHEALSEVEAATNIRAQIVTKRIGNVESMVPYGWWMEAWPKHVGLMITVVDQAEADRDIPKLLDLKARLGIPWVGLSMEPLLGPVQLSGVSKVGKRQWNWLTGETGVMYPDGPDFENGPRIDWVIVGGESGPGARPMHPDWARSLRDQCNDSGVPYFHKQNGEFVALNDFTAEQCEWWNGLSDAKRKAACYPIIEGRQMIRIGKKDAGRLLDGRTWDEMPEASN
jgi:protein gp37